MSPTFRCATGTSDAGIPSMLFNSELFVVFFALTYFLYVVTSRATRLQNFLLLIASYAFYAAWNWKFLSLIIASTLVDYCVAILIERTDSTRRRRLYLLVSVVFNLGMLGFFKYYNFGIESFAALMSHVGLSANFPTLQIVLPVGISFYTFQTMSYTIDVYRGNCKAERDPLLIALYVAFFPQLVAGPIERAQKLIPQLKTSRRVTRHDLALGLNMVTLGYFKKVVIADSLAPLVNEVFAEPLSYSGATVFFGVLGFAVQIYGDFAGYSLIARGIAKLLGIDLMANFRFPYFATSPQDFWRRWHISLSTWLRDYLYIGLGGGRRGTGRTYGNLMATMVLGGLWHGAAWNFVYWGVYHGALLMGCHACKGLRIGGGRFNAATKALAIGLTFVLTLIGWILFRCTSTAQLLEVGHQLTMDMRWSDNTWYFAVPVISAFVLLQLFHYWQMRAGTEFVLLRLSRPCRLAAFAFLVTAIVGVGFRPTPFIYFQF